MHLEEKTLSSETIFEGKIFTVTKDMAKLENGTEAVREVVHSSGGVCVIPLTDNNEIIFVKQFRYPFKCVTLEIPAGKINADEKHYDCGLRELLEETGAVPQEYTYLGEIYPTPAYVTEIIHVYLAKGLSFSEQKLDHDEFLDVVKIPVDLAVEMVMKNEIKDSKTQIAILKTKMLLIAD